MSALIEIQPANCQLVPIVVARCLQAYSELQIQDFLLFKADGVPKSAQSANCQLGRPEIFFSFGQKPFQSQFGQGKTSEIEFALLRP